MKCYILSNDRLSEGLVVSKLHDEKPYVPLDSEWMYRTGDKARFDDVLSEEYEVCSRGGLFSHHSSRIHRCDAELRSEVWIREETAATREQALVHYGLEADHALPEVWTEGGGTFLWQKVEKDKTSISGLVVLPKNSLLRFRTVSRKSIGGVIYMPSVGAYRVVENFPIYQVGEDGTLAPYKSSSPVPPQPW